MIQQLFSDFITKYDYVCGRSRILTAFLVALLFLYLIRDKLGYNPFVLILSPLSAISVAIAKVIERAKKHDKKLVLLFALFLCAFSIMITGERLYSKNHITKAENLMHIPEDYRHVMDYILSQNSNPKVLAMPDYSMYHGMYSSKFEMMYEQRLGDDVRYLSEDARSAFNELSDRNPDMILLARSAANDGCDYIIMYGEHYWPMFTPDEYYELEATIDGWDIYSRKEADNG